MGERNAIFISHATPEGNDFTLWLGAKLSAIGYEVWADVLRLRGGDDWARKLEGGLREKAKKVLLVADAHSVTKQGVRNEIQIATEVARKIGDPEFIIPLRLSNYDAPFLIAHAQYIDFKRSWSDGLAELLDVLEGHGFAKTASQAASIGLENWRHAHLHKARSIERRPERLISNWLPIHSLPQQIRFFDFRAGVNIGAKDHAVRSSSLPLVPHKRGFIGFHSQDEYQAIFGDNFPLQLLGEIELSEFRKIGSHIQDIERQDANRKVIDLLRQSVERYLASRELTAILMANGQLAWWWPKNPDNEGQINFSWANGPTGRRQIIGFLPKSNIHWHYGLSFSPYLLPTPHVTLTSRVIFSEDGKTPFGKPDYMFQLRRSKTKSWRNPRWRDMMLAFLSHLSQGEDQLAIELGTASVMTLTLPPLLFEAPITVSEADVPEEASSELEAFDADDWDDDECDAVDEEEDL